MSLTPLQLLVVNGITEGDGFTMAPAITTLRSHYSSDVLLPVVSPGWPGPGSYPSPADVEDESLPLLVERADQLLEEINGQSQAVLDAWNLEPSHAFFNTALGLLYQWRQQTNVNRGYALYNEAFEGGTPKFIRRLLKAISHSGAAFEIAGSIDQASGYKFHDMGFGVTKYSEAVTGGVTAQIDDPAAVGEVIRASSIEPTKLGDTMATLDAAKEAGTVKDVDKKLTVAGVTEANKATSAAQNATRDVANSIPTTPSLAGMTGASALVSKASSPLSATEAISTVLFEDTSVLGKTEDHLKSVVALIDKALTREGLPDDMLLQLRADIETLLGDLSTAPPVKKTGLAGTLGESLSSEINSLANQAGAAIGSAATSATSAIADTVSGAIAQIGAAAGGIASNFTAGINSLGAAISNIGIPEGFSKEEISSFFTNLKTPSLPKLDRRPDPILSSEVTSLRSKLDSTYGSGGSGTFGQPTVVDIIGHSAPTTGQTWPVLLWALIYELSMRSPVNSTHETSGLSFGNHLIYELKYNTLPYLNAWATADDQNIPIVDVDIPTDLFAIVARISNDNKIGFTLTSNEFIAGYGDALAVEENMRFLAKISDPSEPIKGGPLSIDEAVAFVSRFQEFAADKKKTKVNQILEKVADRDTETGEAIIAAFAEAHNANILGTVGLDIPGRTDPVKHAEKKEAERAAAAIATLDL